MPKSRSLHIGVNSLDPAGYCYRDYSVDRYSVFTDEGGKLSPVEGDGFIVGWRGPLGNVLENRPGCELDADNMAALAKTRGFEKIEVLKTEQAIVSNVEKAILEAADELDAGDFFLVTYSGHGAHVKDSEYNPDEAEGYDETWCLYDRMWLDDEQAYLYSKFRPGVRILALLDSCHSGTGTRSAGEDVDLPPHVVPKDSSGLDKTVYEYERSRTLYDGIQRALEERIAQEKAQEPRVGRRNFHVVSLSACQDNQKAMCDQVEGSWFTNAVRKAFEESEYKNYMEFAEAVEKILARDHSDRKMDPNLDHALWGTRSYELPEAIRNGREITEAEWQDEFDRINAARAKRNSERKKACAKRDDADKPPGPLILEERLTADEKTTLQNLVSFLREEPLRIGDGAT